jgi:hypothetical protein
MLGSLVAVATDHRMACLATKTQDLRELSILFFTYSLDDRSFLPAASRGPAAEPDQ